MQRIQFVSTFPGLIFSPTRHSTEVPHLTTDLHQEGSLMTETNTFYSPTPLLGKSNRSRRRAEIYGIMFKSQ